ncbi:MAG: nucleotide exchange factor GrpE [Candidatus Aphodosoma sp.]
MKNTENTEKAKEQSEIQDSKDQSAKSETKEDNNSIETEKVEESKEAEAVEKQPESEQTKKDETDWEKKYKELNDRHLRLNAEYDNYRKRTAKEKADMIKTAGEKIISDILPVVDNFERALDNMKEGTDVNALKEGVELILKQLIGMMKSHGVEQIATENADFNTDLHEAIAQFPAPTPEQKNKIIDCTTKGYTMHGKVIRHAKVVVGA